MIPKLRIKLYESVLCGKSSDPKARAAVYNHTYFDNKGLDLQVLSHYPSDEGIATIAIEASEEAEALFIFLGVLPDDLHTAENPHTIPLPSIAAWFDSGDEPKLDDDGDDEDGGDVDELQEFLTVKRTVQFLVGQSLTELT
jgi:hypothetical protein